MVEENGTGRSTEPQDPKVPTTIMVEPSAPSVAQGEPEIPRGEVIYSITKSVHDRTDDALKTEAGDELTQALEETTTPQPEVAREPETEVEEFTIPGAKPTEPAKAPQQPPAKTMEEIRAEEREHIKRDAAEAEETTIEELSDTVDEFTNQEEIEEIENILGPNTALRGENVKNILSEYSNILKKTRDISGIAYEISQSYQRTFEKLHTLVTNPSDEHIAILENFTATGKNSDETGKEFVQRTLKELKVQMYADYDKQENKINFGLRSVNRPEVDIDVIVREDI